MDWSKAFPAFEKGVAAAERSAANKRNAEMFDINKDIKLMEKQVIQDQMDSRKVQKNLAQIQSAYDQGKLVEAQQLIIDSNPLINNGMTVKKAFYDPNGQMATITYETPDGEIKDEQISLPEAIPEQISAMKAYTDPSMYFRERKEIVQTNYKSEKQPRVYNKHDKDGKVIDSIEVVPQINLKTRKMEWFKLKNGKKDKKFDLTGYLPAGSQRSTTTGKGGKGGITPGELTEVQKQELKAFQNSLKSAQNDIDNDVKALNERLILADEAIDPEKERKEIRKAITEMKKLKRQLINADANALDLVMSGQAKTFFQSASPPSGKGNLVNDFVQKGYQLQNQGATPPATGNQTIVPPGTVTATRPR